jgi:hypothetical protein
METGQLESMPEIIECSAYRKGWPNISGAKFTGTVDGKDGEKKYSYTVNNLWNKKVTFCLELTGREFEFLNCFKIVKITENTEMCSGTRYQL